MVRGVYTYVVLPEQMVGNHEQRALIELEFGREGVNQLPHAVQELQEYWAGVIVWVLVCVSQALLEAVPKGQPILPLCVHKGRGPE